MRDDLGDWHGQDINQVIANFQTRMEWAHHTPGSPTSAEKLEADSLRVELQNMYTHLAREELSSQTILDRVWAQVRTLVDCGGVTLTYTSTLNPDNIAIAGWSGGTNTSSRSGKTMCFNREFIYGYVAAQGEEVDPAPYLDVKMKPRDSYFETDIMKPTEIDRLIDFQLQMEPYGMQDWVATMGDVDPGYYMVLLSMFYTRPSLQEKAWVRYILGEISPFMRMLMTDLGFIGQQSISSYLGGRWGGTGSMFMNERTGRVNYDYMATKLLAEHSPRAHGARIETIARNAIAQGLRDARESATIREFNISEKADFLRKIGLRTWLRRLKVRNEWYSILTLEEVWHPTEEQKAKVARWDMPMELPHQYGASVGRLARHRDGLAEQINKHIIGDGNVISIRMPKTRKRWLEYPLLEHPAPAIVLEPLTSGSIGKVLSRRHPRDGVLSVTRLQQPNFFEVLEQVISGPCWVQMGRPPKLVAVASLACTHELFDRLRILYV